MISIQQLISVAPFSEEMKQELLTAVPALSDGKKFELEEMCWALISQWYQNELHARQEIAVLEMAEGKKTYPEDYFEKLPDEIFAEFVKKLSIEETKENLESVREKLTNEINKSSV